MSAPRRRARPERRIRTFLAAAELVLEWKGQVFADANPKMWRPLERAVAREQAREAARYRAARLRRDARQQQQAEAGR